MWEHILEFLLHALKDTWPLLPWILLIYVLIELLESKTDLRKINRFGESLGPLVGSATGLIPQCGFSVMAAKLFEQKYITIGTLLAIFMATSDEAFIIMLSSGEGAKWVLPMLAVKILVGVVVGYATDGIMRLVGRRQVCAVMPLETDGAPTTVHEIFIRRYEEEKDVEVNCSCGRSHGGDSAWKNYLLYPIIHTLKVAVFIFLVNFALTAIIHSVGESVFEAFMHRNRFLQPFITCAIGLIPNCASSVVITETFLSQGITFGSCAAGLCANAGMGFVVLLKNVRKWKRNLTLIGVCYCISLAIGLLLNILPIMA
ncbi:MAG: arsenic efflux protein [Clostridia bacterium]|nr:arsenic efflux protein [Clostridia bacterium]MBQ7831620.1 arsenic efflux protein [Clostridia bacterium]